MFESVAGGNEQAVLIDAQPCSARLLIDAAKNSRFTGLYRRQARGSVVVLFAVGGDQNRRLRHQPILNSQKAHMSVFFGFENSSSEGFASLVFIPDSCRDTNEQCMTSPLSSTPSYGGLNWKSVGSGSRLWRSAGLERSVLSPYASTEVILVLRLRMTCAVLQNDACQYGLDSQIFPTESGKAHRERSNLPKSGRHWGDLDDTSPVGLSLAAFVRAALLFRRRKRADLSY